MHEVVEEPEYIFGDDLHALGVDHAGVPNRRGTKQRNATHPAHESKHKLKRQHADPRLFHELVEEPDDIFADDIDALGVEHAGVSENAGKVTDITVNGIKLCMQMVKGETSITIKFPAVTE
jgi:hypothetical protein